jgi:hypothetical protein
MRKQFSGTGDIDIIPAHTPIRWEVPGENDTPQRRDIGVYSLNPKTQRSQWVAIDADYENALEDLLKL